MKILKRTVAILLIFLFILSPVGLNMACPVPTYAADEWEDVTKADLVTAFKYYCKSRNLAIEGSLADALTTFTTDTFNNLVNTLGIDSDSIQAELKKTTQGNLGLRFLFTQTGVNFYNRIFAEFLQNNDLAVGDEVDNKNLYSGKLFSYGDYSCLIWTAKFGGNNGDSPYPNVYILNRGSLLNDGSFFNNLYNSGTTSYQYPFVANPLSISSTSAGKILVGGVTIYGYLGSSSSPMPVKSGGTAIFNIVNNDGAGGALYLVWYRMYTNSSVDYEGYGTFQAINIADSSIDDADVYVTTNNNTINNNDYSKDYTIIYNDGDYYDIDHNYPSPDTPPDGGGGGGGDNPDTPTPPTPPSSTPPDWPIELPDTDIDWIIRGMEERFPWDIPFNVMFALSLLNAEPETPHFEGTIDLKVVQWDYDIDLEPFNQIAEYFRKFFFFSFLVWLLLVTKKLIWG